VRTRVCTLALPDGRIRLRELVLLERHGERTQERELVDDGEWQAVLRERFGVVL